MKHPLVRTLGVSIMEVRVILRVRGNHKGVRGKPSLDKGIRGRYKGTKGNQ